MNVMHNPPHPGEVLREWLEGITITEAADRAQRRRSSRSERCREAAERLGVKRVALSRVLNGAAGVSAEMELRLSKVWFRMQGSFDLWRAQRRFRAEVKPIVARVAD